MEKTNDNEIDTSEKDLIAEATVVAKRIEDANKVHRELLDREEKLRAKQILSGKTDAGVPKQELDETPQEYAKRILRGGK